MQDIRHKPTGRWDGYADIWLPNNIVLLASYFHVNTAATMIVPLALNRFHVSNDAHVVDFVESRLVGDALSPLDDARADL